MFLLMLGRDPIEGLFFTKDLKIQFGPPADLAAAHKWWCLSERHHMRCPRGQAQDGGTCICPIQIYEISNDRYLDR